MRLLVEVLAVLVGAGALGMAGGGVAVLRRIHRGNRLVPTRPSPAPLRWRWSWKRPAHLHRRLQRACGLALVAGATTAPAARRGSWRRPERSPSPFERLAEELVAHAAELDNQLVEASRIPPRWGREPLMALAVKVRSVESGAARLAQLRRSFEDRLRREQGPAPDLGLALDDRLAAVEAALDELQGFGSAGQGGRQAG